MFRPIMTDNEVGPPDLLKIVCYGCKEPWVKSCSCRKAGLNCASTCKECHCITSTNATVIEPEVDDNEYKRNFLEVFA